jgi:phosphoribosylamine--glycine ligase
VTTVVASGGYPGAYQKGREMTVPADLESRDTIVFHAGTKRNGDRLVTSGGRVVAVTGLGADLADAGTRSRSGAGRIEFEGAFFRSDIGWREEARSPNPREAQTS